jgi:hypothetical protein
VPGPIESETALIFPPRVLILVLVPQLQKLTSESDALSSEVTTDPSKSFGREMHSPCE